MKIPHFEVAAQRVHTVLGQMRAEGDLTEGRKKILIHLATNHTGSTHESEIFKLSNKTIPTLLRNPGMAELLVREKNELGKERVDRVALAPGVDYREILKFFGQRK
ncbi:MAG: hypothetical protein WC792_03775 [Candidatus Micrarchaeia archaeon]|jgi:hypothetical protein